MDSALNCFSELYPNLFLIHRAKIIAAYRREGHIYCSLDMSSKTHRCFRSETDVCWRAPLEIFAWLVDCRDKRGRNPRQNNNDVERDSPKRKSVGKPTWIRLQDDKTPSWSAGEKQDNYVCRRRLRHHIFPFSNDGGKLFFV